MLATFHQIPHLTIPRGAIAYGNYSLKLKAETYRKLSHELVGEEEITTWFEIQPSPLVAVIKGGASRSHGTINVLLFAELIMVFICQK